MGKYRFALSSIWFYLCTLLVCLLVENFAFLSSVPSMGLTNEVFYFLTTLTILTFIIYFVSEHKRNKMTLDFILVPILIGLFVCNTIAIWNNPLLTEFTNPETEVTLIVGITTSEKIRATIEYALVLLGIYSMFFVFARKIFKTKQLVWIHYIIIIVSLVFIGISIYQDKNFFISLKEGYSHPSGMGATSVFYNENVFGYYMLLGMISALMITYYKPKWIWMWAIVTIIYIWMVFSTSTTCILLGTALLGTYIVIQIIFGYIHKRFIKTSIGAFCFFGGVVTIVLLIFLGTSSNWKIFVGISNFIQRELLSKNFTDFTGRKEIWNQVFELVKASPFHMALGYGRKIGVLMFSARYETSFPDANLRSVHSGYFDVLLSHGFVGLGIYLLLLSYFLYVCLRLIIKKQVHFTLNYLIVVLALCGHSFFEASPFFYGNTTSTVITLLAFLPPVIMWKQMLHPKHSQHVMANYAMPTQGVASSNFVSFISLILLSVIIPLGMAFISRAMYNNKIVWQSSLLILLFLAISIIFVPYLLFLWYKKATDCRFLIRIILNSIIILGVSGVVGLLAYLKLKYIVPSVLVGLGCYSVSLIIILVIYSLARKGSFIQWFKTTFKGIFVNNYIGVIPASIVVLLIFVIAPIFVPITTKTLFILSLIAIEMFWVVYLCIPSINKRRMLDDINEEALLELKRNILEKKL